MEGVGHSFYLLKIVVFFFQSRKPSESNVSLCNSWQVLEHNKHDKISERWTDKKGGTLAYLVPLHFNKKRTKE